jgi:hypothetical protein
MNHPVLFTNNLDEQAEPMPQVQGQISDGFRNVAGLDTFHNLHLYLAILHEDRANLFHVFILTVQGSPLLPRFM